MTNPKGIGNAAIPALLSIDQAAWYCSMSPNTFRKYCPVKPKSFGSKVLFSRKQIDEWHAEILGYHISTEEIGTVHTLRPLEI